MLLQRKEYRGILTELRSGCPETPSRQVVAENEKEGDGCGGWLGNREGEGEGEGLFRKHRHKKRQTNTQAHTLARMHAGTEHLEHVGDDPHLLMYGPKKRPKNQDASISCSTSSTSAMTRTMSMSVKASPPSSCHVPRSCRVGQ